MTRAAPNWTKLLAVAVLAAAALLVAACGDDEGEDGDADGATAEPTAGDRTQAPTGTPFPTVEPCSDPASCQEQAVQIAVRDLAAELEADPESIEVVSTEDVEWPDACLGVEQEGVACAQVITPGFRIVLESDGTEYEYHTDMGTRAIRVP